ncbi:tripartite tricarboxylate transporter permease [Salipiger bermudensis]|uniref:TRAP-T family transporter, fused small and large inner membrane subunits n=1 Tax=Salipiger bermudensis (strain DSM 26914 / JCM 13377 / KCTC 12554 / HTCC2601) TaxID=314265 RepID=Q0FTV9_SALBH|nr:tripartite tricarboxylate transporter permease [Salipiger bermudensis]EAU47640.1 TRAP-T family transporter, fused small and large inner membrane subunits [Salipiger bermudensis HTCC2601]MAE90310.1 C4-dicarboxylate ABC transporter permease [Pelagibaca sp.]MCA1287082.1 tripartite tricarboxylate transporter permease [Salipiger bermudensis]
MYSDLLSALPEVIGFSNFAAVIIGVIAGIVVGAMPGLSATMAISVLVPFTFGLEPLVALGLMAGIYNGAMYGGAIPAVLLRIPGTPAAVATTFDGYPMAQKGEGGFALQVAVVSSAIGGIASAFALMLLAPPLSKVTLLFGPSEVFWVAVFGLASIIFLLGGNPVKGLISACFGVFVSVIGADPIYGTDRFTFGQLEMLDGISIVILLVGLYALPPVIDLLETPLKTDGVESSKLGTEPIWKAMPRMKGFWKTWLRSSVIGIWIGILPGAGGSMAAFMSYNEARRSSKNPEKWGEGEPEGVAASETANNADTASALIPALTLGIPGTAVAAVMLGGLLVHGLQPGPMLFRENPDVVFGFMWQFLFGAILLILLGGSLATNSFARLLNLPRPLLGSVIIVLMLIGVYSIHGRMFDVYLMLGFGAVGWVMDKLKFPLPPVVLGLILGGFAEENLRLALRIGRGDWGVLFQNTTSLILVALTVAVIVGPIVKRRILDRRKQAES